EGGIIEEQLNAFACGKFAARMLGFDAPASTAQAGFGAAAFQFGEHLFHSCGLCVPYRNFAGHFSRNVWPVTDGIAAVPRGRPGRQRGAGRSFTKNFCELKGRKTCTETDAMG